MASAGHCVRLRYVIPPRAGGERAGPPVAARPRPERAPVELPRPSSKRWLCSSVVCVYVRRVRSCLLLCRLGHMRCSMACCMACCMAPHGTAWRAAANAIQPLACSDGMPGHGPSLSSSLHGCSSLPPLSCSHANTAKEMRVHAMETQEMRRTQYTASAKFMKSPVS